MAELAQSDFDKENNPTANQDSGTKASKPPRPPKSSPPATTGPRKFLFSTLCRLNDDIRIKIHDFQFRRRPKSTLKFSFIEHILYQVFCQASWLRVRGSSRVSVLVDPSQNVAAAIVSR